MLYGYVDAVCICRCCTYVSMLYVYDAVGICRCYMYMLYACSTVANLMHKLGHLDIYVCTPVYAHLCMQQCGLPNAHLCVHTCVCTPVYAHLRVHTYVCSNVANLMHTCVCTSMCAHLCMHTCVCTPVYAHLRVQQCGQPNAQTHTKGRGGKLPATLNVLNEPLVHKNTWRREDRS